MGKDVYRKSAKRDAGPSALAEELVIPILALAVGGLLLFISLWNGERRPTEGGIGTVGVILGVYALVQALRAVRR